MEIRAAQRTFEGAYVRTSLSQFSFALVVLKIFTSEFYVRLSMRLPTGASPLCGVTDDDEQSLGALFALYGVGTFAISLFRRQQGNKQFFREIGEDGLQ